MNVISRRPLSNSALQPPSLWRDYPRPDDPDGRQQPKTLRAGGKSTVEARQSCEATVLESGVKYSLACPPATRAAKVRGVRWRSASRLPRTRSSVRRSVKLFAQPVDPLAGGHKTPFADDRPTAGRLSPMVQLAVFAGADFVKHFAQGFFRISAFVIRNCPGVVCQFHHVGAHEPTLTPPRRELASRFVRLLPSRGQGCSPHDFAVDPRVAYFDERRRANFARRPHQLDGKL